MASPIRVFNVMHRITKTQSTELVNLTKISRIEIKNKKISFTMAHETDSFFGNFIIFSGGGNVTKHIYYDTPEEAKQEFDSIQEQLDKYYKQK
jgi:hypothetical protein